jgi:hypothetical protein
MTITRQRWISLSGLLVFFSVIGSGPAWANSKFLNVQGKLTDNSGNPLTGNQTVTFRLYTSSAGASAIWTESQTVTLSTGLFNVALGSVTALDSLSFNQLYYLGIQVAGDANELSPRQQLGASAYAQGSLGDFNVGGGLVVGSTATVVGTLVASSSVTVGGTLVVGGSVTAPAASFSALIASTVTTSGFISIAGQAIVAGTETVKGSAFSVGGATFTVAAGSITLGGQLNTAAVGIKWADGTTSTTATLGNAVLSATQTWTGANTFSSSVTINGPLINAWRVIASSSPTGGTSSITFSGLKSTTSYHLDIAITQQVTNGTVYIRYNSDSRAGYSYTGQGYDRATLLSYYSDGDTSCPITTNNTSYNLLSGNSAKLDYYFANTYSKSRYVIGHASAGYEDVSGGNHLIFKSECFYDGVNQPLTSVTVGVSAGNFVGDVRLLELGK